jgi:uncharacterized membrane protein
MSKNPLRRHLPFLLAFACGVLVFAVFWWVEPKIAMTAAAITFFLLYLIYTAIRIPRLTAAYLKANAARADEPAAIIFVITLGTVVAAVASLFVLVNSNEPSGGGPSSLDLALSLPTVALGWFTIHTMAALHYSHLYWRPKDREKAKSQAHGGLDFPGGTDPGALDFLYFSFVTGMTAQTSDVEITTTPMRVFNLVHAVVSFFFNTVLVAAAVNVAVSLAS